MFYSQGKNVPKKLQPQFRKQMESNDKQLKVKSRHALWVRTQKKPYLSFHLRQQRGQYISEPVSSQVSTELSDVLKGFSPHILTTFIPGCISKDSCDIMLSSCPIDLLMSPAFPPQMPSSVWLMHSLPQLLQISMRALSLVFVSGAEVTTPPLLIRQGHLPELPATVKGKNTAL